MGIYKLNSHTNQFVSFVWFVFDTIENQRAEMIQAWVDYLFQLKDGYAEVDEKVSIFRKEG